MPLKMVRVFLVEGAAKPVDRLAFGGGLPDENVLGMREYFGHVVALVKTEFFKGCLK